MNLIRLKNLMAAAVLALCAAPAFAQSFVVTPQGLRDAADSSRGFVVIPVEGATARQLYDNAMRYIVKTYANPDKVIKGKIEGEYIRMETFSDDMATLKNGWASLTVTGHMTTELTFKEGKVKYEVVLLDMGITSGPQGVVFQGGLSMSNHAIYNKSGKLQQPEAKKGLEEFFNGDVAALAASLKTAPEKSKGDNW